MQALTREWVQKAEEDLTAAQLLRQNDKLFANIICFHCQQCAEKYLKSLLQETGQPVPKTHDLVRLLTDLLPQFPTLRSISRGLEPLNKYAIDSRYPGYRATARNATTALRWAEKIRSVVRELLEI